MTPASANPIPAATASTEIDNTVPRIRPESAAAAVSSAPTTNSAVENSSSIR